MRRTVWTVMLAIAMCGCAPTSNAARYEKATFAGGCFWCVEAPFEKVPGVKKAVSGYTGGEDRNPTYREVSAGRTGHAEAVQVTFDPARVSYEQLLELFWRQIDPTDAGGQFVDRGTQYRSEIFYHDDAQRVAAERSKERLAASGRFEGKIVTPITPLDVFYPAEEYHQDYYKKNPGDYQRYRSGSGRDQFLQSKWGDESSKGSSAGGGSAAFVKPTDEELRTKLTPLQYEVTQHEATERAFDNEYWDNNREGIYVDVVSGEPLFSSKDKFRSGTGWPSFVRPLEPENLVEKTDRKLLYSRRELRSKLADSHLGHVFPDGPEPTGLRYCINSAALRFVPRDRLAPEGYGRYEALFED